MERKIIECPGCGAIPDINEKYCKFCHNPIYISTFASADEMATPMLSKYVNSYKKDLSEDPDNPDVNRSIAIIYMKLKFYEKAVEKFEKAIEEDFSNADSYFYAAICSLKGKTPFSCARVEIDTTERFLQAAIQTEEKGIYYFLWGFIRYEYYARKSFNVSPNHKELLAKAKQLGVSRMDVTQLFKMLNIAMPSYLGG